jgi:uridine kinase
VTVSAPPDAILIVDSVFAFRPEYNDCWEYRIWLEVDPETAIRRGIARDTAAEGLEEAARVHGGRYHIAEVTYLSEVDPTTLANIIIDNEDFTNPRLIIRRNP